ncbi:hypothetical protein BC827DRAFT_1158017 [Russula dissimulans]|nr:hypothetical protein BC827DRAFT_1158017 [Russula dissimulans]
MGTMGGRYTLANSYSLEKEVLRASESEGLAHPYILWSPGVLLRYACNVFIPAAGILTMGIYQGTARELWERSELLVRLGPGLRSEKSEKLDNAQLEHNTSPNNTFFIAPTVANRSFRQIGKKERREGMKRVAQYA